MTMLEKSGCSARLSKIDPRTLRLANYTGLPRHLFERAGRAEAWCTNEDCVCVGNVEMRSVPSSGAQAEHPSVLEVRP